MLSGHSQYPAQAILPPGQSIPSALYVAQSATSFLHQPRCVLQSPRPPSPGPGTANVGMTPPLDPTVGPHRHRPQQRPGHRDIRNPRHLTTELPPGAANAEFLSSRHFQVHLYSCSFEIVDSGHNIGRNILLSYQMRARPSVYVTMYTTSRCPLPSAHTIFSRLQLSRAPHRHRRLSPQQTLGPDTSPHVVLGGVL